MQDAELLAKCPSNNEQRFDQRRQVGQVLDELPDASLEPHRTNHADLEAESCAEYRAGRCRWRSHTRRLTYWGRAKVLQKQDTLLDAALTVAHAVLKLCRCHPKKRALTRSLCDLTPVREVSQGKSGVSSGV